MRLQQRGWRTARSHAARTGTVAGILPPPAALPAGGPPPSDRAEADLASGMPWQGVQWSLSLIGLLVYLWTIVTFRIRLGEPGMIVALIGLGLMSTAFRFPAFLGVLLAFLAWSTIGYFASPYQWAVADSLQVLAKVFLVAVVVVNALHDRRQQRLFMFVFLAGYAMYPVRGAIFNYVGGYRLFGRAIWNYIYANPNDLASLTLLALGLAAGLFVREPKGWPRIAALSGLAVLPLVILLTQSRGGILALGVFALGALSLQRGGRRMRALGGMLLITLIVIPLAPDSVWNRLSGLRNVTDTTRLEEVDKEGSAEQRFELWKVAATVVRENPVAGIGLGAYKEANAVTSMRSDFKRLARGKRDAHSTYITVAAETGLVGLALFATVFLLVAVQADLTRRRARGLLPHSAQQLAYMELGLLAFFIAGVFASFAQLSFLYIYAALLWTVSATVRTELDAMSGAGGNAVRRWQPG